MAILLAQRTCCTILDWNHLGSSLSVTWLFRAILLLPYPRDDAPSDLGSVHVDISFGPFKMIF